MSIQTIFTSDSTGSELVELAKSTAERLYREELKRAQIRGIFSEARKIQGIWANHPEVAVRRLVMLKPKLDYQTQRNRPVQGLRDILTPAIDMVAQAPAGDERNRRFQIFMDLFEAILAYHRSLGGQ